MRRKHPLTSCDTTEFQLSGGGRGKPDHRELLVLPDTGYAVVRSPQPTGTSDHEGASYLLFTAAFHSRTHKHADDLALTWFDCGREILIDAGRYGYLDPLPADSPLRRQGFFYSAPERRYVESTRAHNTVEVDGVDHERRGRQPYGSALTGAAERHGYFRLAGEVDHGHWRHHREIVLSPGAWLLVTDRVWSLDGHPHDYRVWWNLAGDLALRAGDGGELRAELAGGRAVQVRELSSSLLIDPVAGKAEPMRGWRSKCDLELVPAWSTGFEAIGVRDHVFRTLFRFDNEPMHEPRHPFRSAAQ